MDASQLAARVNAINGLDLSGPETYSLLSEGARELNRRAQYARRTPNIGPTVPGQAAYALPADFVLPIRVTLAGSPIPATDAESVAEYAANKMILGVDSVWYITDDDAGAKHLYLYPAPGPIPVPLTMEFVRRPPDLENPTDAPTWLPEEFHPYLIHYVGREYFRGIEDDPEMGQLHADQFDQGVSQLAAFRIMEVNGDRPFQFRVLGVSA